MSPLWNKPRLRVYVGEDHLALCRLSGHWRPRVVRKEQINIEPWKISAALAVLETRLSAHPLPTDIACVLGSGYVRYLLLPWDADLVDAAFRETLAHALFARSFQDDSTKYAVRFSPACYGQPQLAAFVDKELLAAFELLAGKFGCRIASMEPLLVSVWNRFRARLEHESGTLLIAEADRLLVLRHESGVVSDVQWRPCVGEELAGRIRQGSDTAPVQVFAPLQTDLARRYPASWLGLENREGFSASTDGAYAYALCEVS